MVKHRPGSETSCTNTPSTTSRCMRRSRTASDTDCSPPLATRLRLTPMAVRKNTADIVWSLAAKYEAENWWAALGYARSTRRQRSRPGGASKFNGFLGQSVFTKYNDRWHWRRRQRRAEAHHRSGLAYQWDAVPIEGFYPQRDKYRVAVADSDNFDSFGIGADYDPAAAPSGWRYRRLRLPGRHCCRHGHQVLVLILTDPDTGTRKAALRPLFGNHG